MTDLEQRIIERIRAHGPLRFDEYLESALYDPTDGFYTGRGGAGRGRDFLTSPEVGPLFGAVMAGAVDTWWVEAGRPDEWTLVDAGAGSGALLRSVAAARPACADALRLIAVDRSASQRARHGDAIDSRTDLPEGPITGVVVANELLDNLPWRLLSRGQDADLASPAWSEVAVGARDGALDWVRGPDDRSDSSAARLAPDPPPAAWIPDQEHAVEWLETALDRLERGRVVVLDYMATTQDMASRSMGEWMRTYRAHGHGDHPLVDPGGQDITCEVAVDQLAQVRAPDEHRSQADFLRAHGIDDLVAEGRRIWTERAHLGDLEALTARSRVSEAEALVATGGLGGFTVLEWTV